MSRVAGIPKGLTVGYSFPAEIVGSVLAGALLVVGLVLLLVRTPPELRRRAFVPGGLAALSILVPVALALGGADYVIVRNTILAIVPAAICVAAGYAANRLGLGAAAALGVLLLGITLSVSLDQQYGRTDWRGAAERLDSPRCGPGDRGHPVHEPTALVAVPPGSRGAGRRHRLRARDRSRRPRDRRWILRWSGSGRPTDRRRHVCRASSWWRPSERLPSRSSATKPRDRPPCRLRELAALRLTDIQPGLLLQRPRAVQGTG